MRIVFMGTPDFSVPTLSELVRRGHTIAAVYTRLPAHAGRGLVERLSPAHAAASKLGVFVQTPKSLRGAEAVETLRVYAPDVVVVVAYGLILPPAILDVPPLGCLNLHASLLPRWRGAAPIHRAILAGDARTGVSVMRMKAGLDTGPVASELAVPLSPGMTAGDLHDRLAAEGAVLMADAVELLGRGRLVFTPQAAEGVTYAAKIDKAECRIDWAAPARAVARRIQGLSPFPGAFFEADLGRGRERIKALRAEVGDGAGAPGTVLGDTLTVACGEGAVALVEVQRAGKAPLRADAFLRGVRVGPGARFE